MQNRFLLYIKPLSRVALRVVATASVALFLSSVLRSDYAIAQSICTTIETQLKALEAAKARLQKNLLNAAGGEKQSLVQEIREAEAEIRQKQAELMSHRCKGVVMKWNVAGRQREALVFPPIVESTKNHPLVFAFHGHGGTMQNAAQQMHLHDLWTDAIVVYPQGLKTETKNDPDANRAGWQKETDSTNRDLKFFGAMLTSMRQKYSVDDTQIYSTGFSNGTGFTYLLWAERGDVFAAIGAVAGVLADSEQSRLSQARALIAIFGKGDGTAPDSVKEKTINRAREVDNAMAQGEQCPIPNGAPNLTKCILFPSTSHTPVKNITHPGGHVYPSWAPDEIVEFFKHHKRP